MPGCRAGLFAAALCALTVALASAPAQRGDAPAAPPAPADATAAPDVPELAPPVDASRFVDAFRFSDPRAFRVEVDFDAEGRPREPVLRLVGGASYAPAVRSPLGIALWSGHAFGDFTLDVEVQQTGREYAHRDLCVVFGHRAHDRFYYAHLASRADPHAHNIFVVDGAPRRAIATGTTEGVDWGGSDAWHRVRVTRRGARIEVFFDDMATPILVADDATHGVGRLGFGSFDDEGRFRAIRVRGTPIPAGDALAGAAPFHRPVRAERGTDGGDPGRRSSDRDAPMQRSEPRR